MPEVQIKRQRRKSLVMRVTPAGDVVVNIPNWLNANHPQVRQFISDGLEKLNNNIPVERPAPLHDAATIRVMVMQWADRIGLDVGRVQLRDMTRKWGSCSSKGNITLNTALYYIPHHLVEYVVVHELVHMIVFDHSIGFWQKLGEYLPDYRDRERELNTYRV